MEHNLDNVKQALLQLPEEAVGYLFPLLHQTDIYRMLGLDVVSPILFREFPTEQSIEKTKPERKSRKRPSPRRQEVTYSQESLFPDEDFHEDEEAVIEQRIREDDERGQFIRQVINRVLEETNTTIRELRDFLDFPLVYSHLVVTGSGHILLTDFNNREVKMDTLSKVIFIFYLRHPEGVAFNELWDHRAEMLKIYGKITRRLNQEALEESINSLCNPVERNSINEKVSRVKKAFINAVDEDIAEMYYIKGPAGGIRKIELRRDLIRIDLLL